MESKNKKSAFKSYIISVNVEKILFITFFIFFSSLVITQIVLIATGLEKGLSTNSAIEGLPLKKEEFLYKEGELVLELLSEYKGQGHDVKILVNGEEVDDFSFRKVSLKIKNGDVVEIDATNISNNIDVMIKSKSSNVIIDDLSKKYSIKSEVIKIIKVKIE